MRTARIDGDRGAIHPRRALPCLVLGAALVLSACDRQAAPSSPAEPSPTPLPTPEPGYAGIPVEEPPPAGAPGSSTASVEAAEEVNTDPSAAENQSVKAEVLEVLTRIDAMPKLTPEEKDKLYVMVDRARGMGKIITIPFPSGKTSIGPAEVAALKEKLELAQIREFTDDPTVVFVVLGYADKKGDPKLNASISLARAESVVTALKERLGVMNVIHAVGMGGSELFDAQNLDKNRVVEVWVVLP